jgi:hypothetical protein
MNIDSGLLINRLVESWRILMGCMNLTSHEEQQQQQEELMSRVILELGVFIDSTCVCIA